LTELVPKERDPMVGQVIGGYKVLERLGIGGMGAVYAAVETSIDKRSALKIVHPHLSDDPKLPTLLAEARSVNAIGDEGIVDIYAFGTLPDGRAYLVMELLEGELLETRLARQGPLSAIETIDILAPLLQALEAAHAAGFVHRDLKSANVFIVERAHRAPFPKLLDFGIAQSVREGAVEALGTPAYIAPEQAANTNVGPKADLYALGCLAFEMLCGQLPFRDPDWHEVMRLHREAPRPSLLPFGVPAAMDEVVRSLMAPEAARRPASAAVVRSRLLEIRASLQPKAALRLPRLWGALAVLAVVVGVAGLVLMPARPEVKPGPVATVDPVDAQAIRVAGEVEKVLATAPLEAVDALLSAQKSFPGRAEWVGAKTRLTSLLRHEAQERLRRGEVDQAVKHAAALARLEPDQALEAKVKRTAFALHNGMVQVGDVFVDRYEYPNRANARPTTKVDWADAVKLCEEAGKHLCSEDEWQVACKGDTQLAFPWGDTLERDRCLVKGRKVKGPVAAGSKAKCVGAAGVFDLVGNVAEWTSTAVRDGKPQRVTRGGSFMQSDSKLGCDARDYSLPGLGGFKHIGLRCCL
jgi:tRNA A-37 threonylcarbamoyl transferase component Bud32